MVAVTNILEQRAGVDGTRQATTFASDMRRMVQAELLGSHSHITDNGVQVSIWKRDNRYLARGKYEGQPFGPTLGDNEKTAAAELRRIMVAIENGTYVRPSDPKAKQLRKRKPVPNLTLEELINKYLADKRAIRGKSTSNAYRSRLDHVLAFSQQQPLLRRYRLAQDLDRQFVVELKQFLQQRMISRNGHPNGPKQLMSPRQVLNVLEALRDLLNYAMKPAVRALPSDFVQPVTPDILGRQPRKDPLRKVTFPLERRLRFIPVSDAFDLVTLGMMYILPCRPEQFSGLLVPEIDWNERTLAFGTRLGGADYTKGKVSFRVPYPDEMEPLLRLAVGGRQDGPVFLRRSVFEGAQEPEIKIARLGDMDNAITDALTAAGQAGPVAPGDGKSIVRATIAAAGGITPDQMGDAFAKVIQRAGVCEPVRFYDLRSSVESEIGNIRGILIPHVRYVMGQEQITGGSLDEYHSFSIEDVRESLRMHWDFAKEIIQAIITQGHRLRVW